MSYQWIFDNAQDIQINRRGVVATTVARDQTVRSISRGGQIWRFTVLPSSGTRIQDPGVRSYLETIDNLDRFTPVSINMSHLSSAYLNLFSYQGNIPPTTVTVTQGSNQITLTGGSGNKFKSGDVFQLVGQKYVYSIVGDASGSTAQTNRPILEASGTYSIVVGSSVTWNLICTQLPDWKITAGGIINWTQPFVFYESLA
jgi:hypothetical protein